MCIAKIRITILVATLASCSISATVDHLLKFIHAVKSGVMLEEPKCTTLVITTDRSLDYTEPVKPQLDSTIPERPLETYFMVDLHSNSTSNKQWSPAPYVHYRPCSLLLVDITGNLLKGDNVSLSFDRWPVLPYAGSMHTCYHFFFADITTELPDVEELLLEFAKTTRKLQYVFFTLMQSDGVFDILIRTAFAERLYLRSTSAALYEGERFLKDRINFNGETMIGTVCVICDKSLEVFHETGTWDDFLAATMYELSLYANATLELSPAFGAPRTGLTLEGEWDGFVQPLIDGTGVLTQLIEPTPENTKVIFSAKTYFFDNVVFMTGRPKKFHHTSLSRLSKPLRASVWLFVGLSFVCVCIALEVIIEVCRIFEFEQRAQRFKSPMHPFLSPLESSLIWESIPKHQLHLTPFALLAAALDQAAITGADAKHLEGYIPTRFLVALWYITLIVLGCAYKSDLTSMIVKPLYTHPPTTYAELAESDYKVGAVFYTGSLESNFDAFNTTVIKTVQSRIYEYDWLEPDCYVKVLQEKSVCIGTHMSMPRLSAKFVMDIWGRPLYLFSKEEIFPLFMNMGLSMYFPSLLGKLESILQGLQAKLAPLNYFVGWFQSTGCYIKWDRHSQKVTELEGKAAARKLYEQDKMYSGEEIDDGTETSSKVMLYIQVLTLGHSASLVFFLCEIFGGLCGWLRLNRLVVTNDFLRGPIRRVLD